MAKAQHRHAATISVTATISKLNDSRRPRALVKNG
jgi:hypothetical protein